MSRPDLGVQQTPNYFLPHNRTDNFEPVTPPDSASWDSYDSKNSDSPPDYKTPLWQPVHTDISQFTDVDFPKENSVSHSDSTGQFTELYSTEDLCNGNNGLSLECSPVDLQNLPSPLSNIDTDFLVQGESPDSSTAAKIEREVTNGLSQPRDWKVNALKYPPCVVCSGKSSGLHYGCYTCEACKNFFRRYLLRSGGFICKKNNNCVISNRSRGNCSGCRLKKCLDVGMSKDKSKIGRYTHAQRTETIREVNKLEGKGDNDPLQLGTLDLNEIFSTGANEEKPVKTERAVEYGELTEEEQGFINILVEAMDNIKHFGEKGSTPEGREEIITEHYEKYLAKVKLFGPLKAIPKDEYFTLLKMYNIDLDGRWNLFKREANNCAHIVTRYCEFAYKIKGFQQINVKDQEILLKIGHCDFFIILMHEGYDHERQIFLEMNGVPSHVEEAAGKIFSRELVEGQADLFNRWQNARLLREEKALLMAMSLLCSDRIELEDPKSVSDLHFNITEILLKLMRSAHGKDAQKRFSKFIDILIFSRQASYGYFKEYQEMSQNEMVTDAVPAFPTLCPDQF